MLQFKKTFQFKSIVFLATTLLMTANASAAYLGLRVQNLPLHVRAQMPDEVVGKIENNQGVIVDWLEDISPAADDGIQLYDVVISTDGQPIASPREFIQKIAQAPAGQKFNLIVVRQGKVREVPVTVTAPPVGERMTPAPVKPALYQLDPASSQSPKKPSAQFYPANAHPLNMVGKPALPMRKKPETHAWGTERNIWPDFYTKGTNNMWDDMINAPFKMGRMPGGMRAPSLSMPDPVTIGDAVTNQMPPMAEEAGNMIDFSKDKK